MENSIEVPQKTENRITIWPSSLFGIYPDKTIKRYRHSYVHSSSIHNSQDAETTLMSINRWMEKEDVIHIYNRVLLSHKKNKISAATWLQLEIIMLSEVSQRKTNTMWYHLYVESKIWHKSTYLWNRDRLDKTQRTDLWLPRRERRDELGVWS